MSLSTNAFKEAVIMDQTEPSKKKKKHKKDSQLIIRIKSEERDQFVALCDELDTSAAREVRHFIRSFMKKHLIEKKLKIQTSDISLCLMPLKRMMHVFLVIGN